MRRCLLVLQTGGGWLVLGLLMGLASGCASSPGAKFLHVACDRVVREGNLQAVSFGSSIKTRGLAGQQVIYRVGVVDSRLQPLRSANRRFRNTAGNVGASKALIVHESPWTFENVRVTIPLTELEIDARDLPVMAEFSVCLPSGECLAQETTVIPVYRATHARRTGPRLEPDAPVATHAQRQRKPAPDEKREASSPLVARRKKSPSTAPKRRSATSKPVARATTRRESDQPTDDVAHSLDWWRDTVAGAETRAAHAVGVLFPFDLVFAATEPDELSENDSQSPTSNPAPKPASEPVSKGKPADLPVEPAPTSAQTPNEDQPDDDERPNHRLYVVQSGDTLWHIAERLLGDASRWHEILDINRDRLSSPHELRVGLELRIPPDVEDVADERPEQ